MSMAWCGFGNTVLAFGIENLEGVQNGLKFSETQR